MANTHRQALDRLLLTATGVALVLLHRAVSLSQDVFSAVDFAASIGVNVHWTYPDFSNNHAFYVQKVIELGVGHVRDGVNGQSVNTAKNELGPRGVKTLLLTGRRFAGPWPQKLDACRITAEIADVASAPAGYVCGIEGPNEYDTSKPASETDRKA